LRSRTDDSSVAVVDRTVAFIRRFRRRLAGEAGIALVMSVGVLALCTITGMTVVVSATSGSASASRSSDDEFAFSLSEAGLNNALAVLANPVNNALDPALLPASEATAMSAQYEQGTAKWWATLDPVTAVWTVTAVGLYNNPTGAGAAQVRRTLTARVPVTPVAPQDLAANNQAWQYMFATSTGNECDMTLNNHVTGASRLYANGNLCINNNADFLGEALIVKGSLYLGNGSDVGNPVSMATRVETHVGGADGCRYHNDSWHNPCTDSDHVYGKKTPPNWIAGVNNVPPTIATPTVDFPGWYEHAIPGPATGCAVSTGTVPVFDNDYPSRNTSVPLVELTPSGSSYTCRVGPEDNPIGELSWDHITNTLTVKGVVFIDGNVKTSGTLNRYTGQATLYVSGTFTVEGKLCGGLAVLSCDFSTWNPNSTMLTVVAGGNSGLEPYSVNFGNDAQFQGALYATSAIYLGTWAKSDGPMVGSTIVLSNHVTTDPFPFITTVPPGMPGNPNVYAQPNPPQLFAG
jgi:hypothetical protein